MHHDHLDLGQASWLTVAVVGAHGVLVLLVVGLLARFLHGRAWRGDQGARTLDQAMPARALGPLAARQHRGVAPRSREEQVLDLALAKGELDVAEYHQRRSALRSTDG